MKFLPFIATLLLAFNAQAIENVLYSDLKISCSSKDLSLNLSQGDYLSADGWNTAAASLSSTKFQIPGLENGAVSGLQLNKESRTLKITDAFNVEYTFKLPALLTTSKFKIEVKRFHEKAGIDSTHKLSCKSSLKTEEQTFLEAIKANLKKLSLDELLYVLTYDNNYAQIREVRDFAHDLDLAQEKQLNHYANGIQLKSDSLRSSYTKYYNRIDKEQKAVHADCMDNYDPTDEDFESNIADDRLCNYGVELALDKNGKFIAALVWHHDANGTDDYDDDSFSFSLLDWSGKTLFESEWSN